MYACIGISDVATVTAAAAFLDDHGGNWAELAFAGAGRAVFYGYDHDYSDTVDVDLPLDLLDAGPAWLP